jgi:hypothetical protein
MSDNNAVVIQYLETLRGICSLLEKISYDETGTCVDDVIEALKQSLAQPQAPVVPEDEYLCPNCVTPWKCNGPHIPEPAQRDERDAETIGYINGLIYAGNLKPRVQRGDGGSRVLNDIREQIDAAIALQSSGNTKGEGK